MLHTRVYTAALYGLQLLLFSFNQEYFVRFLVVTIIITHDHRRTGNFLPGGAVNHLPKKFSQVAQIFTKKSKRNEGHIRCSNIGLLTK